ncbi:MAG: hypothetical protein Q8Q29_10505 [Actinomycetota bacterium]|nr:hypothetical protein [Actinomycetota bacterium]
MLWRRPGNVMGWVFSGMGVSGLVAGAAPEVGVGELFGRLGCFSFLFLTVAILPMLFPTGRPLTPRWRWALYGTFVAYAAIAFLVMFQEQLCAEWLSGPAGDRCLRRVDNPIGIPGIEDPEGSVAGAILFGRSGSPPWPGSPRWAFASVGPRGWNASR